MSLILNLTGEQILLTSAINYYTADLALRFGLFRNDYTPTRFTNWGDLVEASGGGYARQIKNAAAWATPGGSVPGYTITTQPADFIFTSVPTYPTMYGWFVMDVNNNLIGAERFPTPITIAQIGDRVRLNCRLQLWDEKDLDTNKPVTWPWLSVNQMLNTMLNKITPGSQVRFDIFNSNTTPSESTVFADLTFPPATDYLWGTVFSHADHTIGNTTGDVNTGIAKYHWAPYTMTNVAYSGTVYGWDVRDQTNGKLHCLARFPSPLTIAPGAAFVMKVSYTLRDYNYTPP